MNIILVPVVMFLASMAAASSDDANAKFAGKSQMSGYRFEDYKDFQKNMKLVTVRFRKDTGEMRLTYANSLAFNELKKKKPKYPDGSVFLKVGIKTEEDPRFLSSAIPSGARRLQLMVKNKKKHAETDGWGYALFDQGGKTFPEDPALQVIACHACHKIVPDLDYVFSQPFAIDFSKPQLNLEKKLGLTFVRVGREVTPQNVKGEISAGVEELIKLNNSALESNAIQGTFDELGPSLHSEAAKSLMPVFFAEKEGERAKLVIPVGKLGDCTNEAGEGVPLKDVFLNGEQRYERSICYNLR